MATSVQKQPASFALTADETRAFTFLGWVFDAAQHQGKAPTIAQWVDPDPPGPDKYRYVRDFLLAEAIPRWNNFEIGQKRDLYKKQLSIAMAGIQRASCQATQALLGRQDLQLRQLQGGVLSAAGQIADAAKKVRSFVHTQQQPELTREQTRDVVDSHGRNKGTVVDRLRRVQYLNAIRILAAQVPKGPPGADAALGFRYLRTLMAHPRGVQLVDAFAASPAEGSKTANDVIQQSRDSSRTLGQDLTKEPAKVWRFRAAIAGALYELNLQTHEAIVQFSLAWCATRRDPVERVLQIAGNAVMVIGFMGPHGRAVAAILGVALAGAETTVSYLKALEQDRAAEATAFASPAERLSEGASMFETALLGGSTILAALAVPGELSAVTGGIARLERNAAAVASQKALQEGRDFRGVLNKGTALENIATVERDTAALPTSSAARRTTSAAGEDVLAGAKEGSTLERATTRPTPGRDQINAERRGLERDATAAESKAAKYQDLDREWPTEPQRDPRSITNTEVEAAKKNLADDFKKAIPTKKELVRATKALNFEELAVNPAQKATFGSLTGRKFGDASVRSAPGAASAARADLLRQAEADAADLRSRIKVHWDSALPQRGELTSEQIATNVLNEVAKITTDPKKAGKMIREKLFTAWRDRFLRRVGNDSQLVTDLNQRAGVIFNPNPGRNGNAFSVPFRDSKGGIGLVGLDVDHAAIGHEQAVIDALRTSDPKKLLSTIDSDGLQLLTERENRNVIESIRKDSARWPSPQGPSAVGATPPAANAVRGTSNNGL